jgi:HAMP domain-containing protein
MSTVLISTMVGVATGALICMALGLVSLTNAVEANTQQLDRIADKLESGNLHVEVLQ